MSFNGNEGSLIPHSEAAAATKAWRDAFPQQPLAFFIGKDRLAEIIMQDGAEGVRIYPGLDPKGVFKPILVAANADENDIIGHVMDNCSPCPPRCSTPNILNS